MDCDLLIHIRKNGEAYMTRSQSNPMEVSIYVEGGITYGDVLHVFRHIILFGKNRILGAHLAFPDNEIVFPEGWEIDRMNRDGTPTAPGLQSKAKEDRKLRSSRKNTIML